MSSFLDVVQTDSNSNRLIYFSHYAYYVLYTPEKNRNICYYTGDCFEALQVEHYHFPVISQYKLPPLIVISLRSVLSSDPLTFLFLQFCSM